MLPRNFSLFDFYIDSLFLSFFLLQKARKTKAGWVVSLKYFLDNIDLIGSSYSPETSCCFQSSGRSGNGCVPVLGLIFILPSHVPGGSWECDRLYFTWQAWCEDKMPIFTTITGRDSTRLHHIPSQSSASTEEHQLITSSSANNRLTIVSVSVSCAVHSQTCNYHPSLA